MLLLLGIFLTINASFCVPSVKAAMGEIQATCEKDAVLTCTASAEPGVQYRALRWYKVNENLSSPLSGLLRKNLLKNETDKYDGFHQPLEFLDTESFDIILRNVSEEDSGKYSCVLSAPLGKQNKEGFIQLKVSGCADGHRDWSVHIDIMYIVGLLLAFIICYMSWRGLKNVLKNNIKEQLKQYFYTNQQKTLLALNGNQVQAPIVKTCPDGFWV
ncbi:CD83 antigen [Amia ocellicauda]|uniref:CD83 antigen n=1 Tax=Amia ocellicauda TaxID=2972642 RepID=UPI0034643216